MRIFLFFFAATGWTFSLIVHLTALIGDYDLSRKIPFIWVLHIGIFVVWFPMVFMLKNNPEIKELKNNGMTGLKNQLKFTKVVFKKTPKWLIAVAIIGFIYAMVNFILFAISQPGVPVIRNGHYTLQNHGHVIKTLTEAEYNQYLANQVRGFSGHWIAFYGIAAAFLFQFRAKDSIMDSKHQGK